MMINLGVLGKIVSSRFKKGDFGEKELKKLKICKKCEFNSLNVEKSPLNKRVLKWWSDLYSKLTGNAEKDILGSCTACASCSVYYKVLMSNGGEDCPKGYWKSIYMPNSARKEK